MLSWKLPILVLIACAILVSGCDSPPPNDASGNTQLVNGDTTIPENGNGSDPVPPANTENPPEPHEIRGEIQEFNDTGCLSHRKGVEQTFTCTTHDECKSLNNSDSWYCIKDTGCCETVEESKIFDIVEDATLMIKWENGELEYGFFGPYNKPTKNSPTKVNITLIAPVGSEFSIAAGKSADHTDTLNSGNVPASGAVYESVTACSTGLLQENNKIKNIENEIFLNLEEDSEPEIEIPSDPYDLKVTRESYVENQEGWSLGVKSDPKQASLKCDNTWNQWDNYVHTEYKSEVLWTDPGGDRLEEIFRNEDQWCAPMEKLISYEPICELANAEIERIVADLSCPSECPIKTVKEPFTEDPHCRAITAYLLHNSTGIYFMCEVSTWINCDEDPSCEINIGELIVIDTSLEDKSTDHKDNYRFVVDFVKEETTVIDIPPEQSESDIVLDAIITAGVKDPVDIGGIVIEYQDQNAFCPNIQRTIENELEVDFLISVEPEKNLQAQMDENMVNTSDPEFQTDGTVEFFEFSLIKDESVENDPVVVEEFSIIISENNQITDTCKKEDIVLTEKITDFVLKGELTHLCEDPVCGEWRECLNDKQTRTCKQVHELCPQPVLEKNCGEDIVEDGDDIDTPPCTESWSCGNWGEWVWGACVDSLQDGSRTRTCTDANDCGTTGIKPAESETTTRSCGDPVDCIEDWTCNEWIVVDKWSECEYGGDGVGTSRERDCTDENECGTEDTKPDEYETTYEDCSTRTYSEQQDYIDAVAGGVIHTYPGEHIWILSEGESHVFLLDFTEGMSYTVTNSNTAEVTITGIDRYAPPAITVEDLGGGTKRYSGGPSLLPGDYQMLALVVTRTSTGELPIDVTSVITES